MTQVVHVISSSGLYGAERSILGLIKCVTTYEHQVICFDKPSGSHIPFVETLKSEDVPVTVLPDGYGALRSNAKWIAGLKPNNEPLFLHAHGYKGTMTCSYIRRVEPNSSLICTQHGFTNKSFKTRMFSRLETLLIKSGRVDHVICASNLIHSFYVSKNFPASKLTYVANAVDMPDLSESAIGWDARDIDFLYLGRLSIEKGPDILLEAIAMAKSEGVSAKVSIAGDGPLMDALRTKASEYDLIEDVSFLGFVSDPASLLARAKWLVMPSRTEGLPMSALEAMSHQTPLIAAAVGELPVVIGDNQAGILVPSNDVSALSEALQIASQSNPENWLKKIAARIRNCVRALRPSSIWPRNCRHLRQSLRVPREFNTPN